LAQQLEDGLRQNLVETEQVSFDPPHARLNGRPDAVEERSAEARRLMQQGSEAANNFDLDGATSAYREALTLWESAAVHLSDLSPLVDCLFLIGAAETLNGRSRQARSTFQRVAALDPDYEPDADVHPPDIVSAFTEARNRHRRFGHGRLNVTSTPPGAAVYLDGAYVGPAPQRFDRLRPGVHYVTLRRDGYVEAGEQVFVRSRRVVNTDVTLEPMTAALDAGRVLAQALADPEAQGVEAAVTAYGEQLGADVVMTVSIGPSGDQVEAEISSWRVSDGVRVETTTRGPWLVQDESGEAMTADLQSTLQDRLRQVPAVLAALAREEASSGADEDDSSRVASSTPVWRKWWFWTLITAGVAGAAVGAGFGIASALDKEPSGGEVVISF
jgi:hypothetical protein